MSQISNISRAWSCLPGQRPNFLHVTFHWKRQTSKKALGNSFWKTAHSVKSLMLVPSSLLLLLSSRFLKGSNDFTLLLSSCYQHQVERHVQLIWSSRWAKMRDLCCSWPLSSIKRQRKTVFPRVNNCPDVQAWDVVIFVSMDRQSHIILWTNPITLPLALMHMGTCQTRGRGGQKQWK